MERIADYIASQTERNALICLDGVSTEQKTHAYLITEKYSDRTVKLYDFEDHWFTDEEFDNCAVFFLVGNKPYSDKKLKGKFSKQLQLKNKYSIGVMEVYRLECSNSEEKAVLQGEAITDIQAKNIDPSDNKRKEPIAPVRLPALYLKDIFGNNE